MVVELADGLQSHRFPWYDSPWLAAYLDAKDVISRHSPGKLGEFVSAMESFRAPVDFDVQVVKDVLSRTDLSDALALVDKLRDDQLDKQEILSFGRLVKHNHPLFNDLQVRLADLVSELAGEDVEPSYNFLSLYNNLGVCRPHLDAPTAKWTLDICLQQSQPWPISFSQVVDWPEEFVETDSDWWTRILENEALDFKSFALEENQAILFTGNNQWHYRDRIPRTGTDNYCHLLFLHYIPKGASRLVDPNSWAEIFNVPELSNRYSHVLSARE